MILSILHQYYINTTFSQFNTTHYYKSAFQYYLNTTLHITILNLAHSILHSYNSLLLNTTVPETTSILLNTWSILHRGFQYYINTTHNQYYTILNLAHSILHRYKSLLLNTTVPESTSILLNTSSILHQYYIEVFNTTSILHWLYWYYPILQETAVNQYYIILH